MAGAGIVPKVEGALLGVALTALVATGGNALGATWSLGWLDLSFVGLASGAVVGWRSVPGALEARRPWLYALRAALLATLLGTGIVLVLMLATTVGTASGAFDATALIFLPLTFVYGLVFGLPVTVPIALVGLAALRASSRRRGIPALVSATAIALSGVFLLSGPSSLSLPSSIAAGPVRLEWTVANRSMEGLVLAVGDPGVGSIGWWERGIAPCFITTGSSDEAVDWVVGLRVDRRSEDQWEDEDPFADPLVSAADVPGADARVWIDVDADGRMTLIPGRPAPSGEALTVDLCGPVR